MTQPIYKVATSSMHAFEPKDLLEFHSIVGIIMAVFVVAIVAELVINIFYKKKPMVSRFFYFFMQGFLLSFFLGHIRHFKLMVKSVMADASKNISSIPDAIEHVIFKGEYFNLTKQSSVFQFVVTGMICILFVFIFMTVLTLKPNDDEVGTIKQIKFGTLKRIGICMILLVVTASSLFLEVEWFRSASLGITFLYYGALYISQCISLLTILYLIFLISKIDELKKEIANRKKQNEASLESNRETTDLTSSDEPKKTKTSSKLIVILPITIIYLGSMIATILL